MKSRNATWNRAALDGRGADLLAALEDMLALPSPATDAHADVRATARAAHARAALAQAKGGAK